MALLLFMVTTASAQKSNAVDLTEVPIEALMEMEVPKVYGASKIEQKTTERRLPLRLSTRMRSSDTDIARLLISCRALKVSMFRMIGTTRSSERGA